MTLVAILVGTLLAGIAALAGVIVALKVWQGQKLLWFSSFCWIRPSCGTTAMSTTTTRRMAMTTRTITRMPMRILRRWAVGPS